MPIGTGWGNPSGGGSVSTARRPGGPGGMTEDTPLSWLATRLRDLLTSGPVAALGVVLLAAGLGVAMAWLNVLRPPPPPSATSAFIRIIGGTDKDPL